MGIKGLFSYIESYSIGGGGSISEHIPAGSIVLIDGNGLIFHIVNSYSDIMSRQFGGSYDIFDKKLRSEMSTLTAVFGLTLRVYFDGKISRMKEATARKRIVKDEETWLNLLNYCQSGTHCKQDGLPIPPLYFDQLRATLETLNVDIITCEEEADQEIAKACALMNDDLTSKGGQYCFCYANDSDFLLMKDCPYVKFGSLSKPMGYSDGCMARVWRRSELAADLGLSESQFVELALLIGNDYTGVFPRSQLQLHTETSSCIHFPCDGNCSVKSIDVMVEYIRSLPSNYKLTSSNTSLQIALEYSRALYELRDISSYPEDSKHTRLMALRDEQLEVIQRYVKDRVDSMNLNDDNKTKGMKSKMNGDDDDDVASIAIDYLHTFVKDGDGSELSELGEDLYSIPLDNVQSLETMVQQLSVMEIQEEEGGDDDGMESVVVVLDKKEKALVDDTTLIPHWNDVIAAHQYQLICKEIFKCLRNNNTTSNSNNNNISKLTAVSFQPWRCFNGIIRNSDSNALPIDAFREEILHRVNRDRVTVIHGETGCGKSSRVPAMLLEHAIEHDLPCRMMVSQPRRIAASSLMKRLRTTLGQKVGLRMGHGVRDEYGSTRIFFVTTGYLVRLIAHHPGAFHNHTHIIIDEVHERSVDGDVLCLLTRRLLQSHPTLRVILMSATIHTQLYKDYFTNQREYYGPLDCLSVGARRFPANILHAEDLVKYPQLVSLTRECNGDGQDKIPHGLANVQYTVAVGLIKQVVKKGTGVLVFVSGMLDIFELAERLNNLSHIRICIIHSEIPFEDQEEAFLPTASNEVKVIIATNAAESSITLPDVDVVICLGTHKSMRYVKQNHCEQLVNTWISKASAIQRAGRTGRVRPGSVYRLYSRNLSEKFDEHEMAEVHRQPMQDTILRLRAMLEDTDSFEGVVPVLMDLLEPPDMENVEKSFDYLFRADMLSRPDDSGELTSLGKFAGNLPIDLRHTRLLAYGIALGLKNEAVVMAAAFTLAKPPFIVGSPLIFTDPDQYNHVVMKAFLGNVRLDAGLYSQPIMLLCMLIRWRSLSSNDSSRKKWSEEYGLSFKTMKQFESSARHLADRVDILLNGDIDDDELNRNRVRNDIFHGLDYPSRENINLLRLLLVWSSDGNILRMKPIRMKAESERTCVTVIKPRLSRKHLFPLFPPSIPFALVNEGSRMYSAFMTPQQEQMGLSELFVSLCALATSVKAPFVWLHMIPKSKSVKGQGKGKRAKNGVEEEKRADGEEEEKNDGDGDVDVDVEDAEGVDEKEKDRKGDHVTVVGVHLEHKELLMSKLERIFTPDRLDCYGNIQEEEEGCPFEAFVCKSPNKTELNLLNAIHADLPLCLRMGVYGSEFRAVLMAYNCIPSYVEMRKLFFGCNVKNTSDDMTNDDKSNRISEQIHGLSHKIVFPTVDSVETNVDT
eukprot:gene5183-10365_t